MLTHYAAVAARNLRVSPFTSIFSRFFGAWRRRSNRHVRECPFIVMDRRQNRPPIGKPCPGMGHHKAPVECLTGGGGLIRPHCLAATDWHADCFLTHSELR
jgi:hypothetical protein